MSRYCLDTSAYSHYRRGDDPVVRLIDSAEWIGLPAVVIGELWTGFLRGRQLDRNITELDAFLAHPVVEQVLIDGPVGRIYAEILIDLRGAGTPLPTNDIWVAAAAARCGATVLTYDDHFNGISRVGSIVLG